MTSKVRTVEVINPPMTTVANGRCTSAPMLVASAMGRKPRLATNAVIKTGLSLCKVSDTQRPAEIAEDMEAEAEEEGKTAGRIDWILFNPATLDSGDPAWCAVETQAPLLLRRQNVPEFDAYAAAPAPALFPVGRRPDYRSSGLKRLAHSLMWKCRCSAPGARKSSSSIDSSTTT